jgi:hypothetical protein
MRESIEAMKEIWTKETAESISMSAALGRADHGSREWSESASTAVTRPVDELVKLPHIGPSPRLVALMPLIRRSQKPPFMRFATGTKTRGG